MNSLTYGLLVLLLSTSIEFSKARHGHRHDGEHHGDHHDGGDEHHEHSGYLSDKKHGDGDYYKEMKCESDKDCYRNRSYYEEREDIICCDGQCAARDECILAVFMVLGFMTFCGVCACLGFVATFTAIGYYAFKASKRTSRNTDPTFQYQTNPNVPGAPAEYMIPPPYTTKDTTENGVLPVYATIDKK